MKYLLLALLALALNGCGQVAVADADMVDFTPRAPECADKPRSAVGSHLFSSYKEIVSELPNVDHAFEKRQSMRGKEFRREATFVSGNAAATFVVQGQSLDTPKGFAVVYSWPRGTSMANITSVDNIAGEVLDKALKDDAQSLVLGMVLSAELSRQQEVLDVGGQPKPSCHVLPSGLVVEVYGSNEDGRQTIPIVFTATTAKDSSDAP